MVVTSSAMTPEKWINMTGMRFSRLVIPTVLASLVLPAGAKNIRRARGDARRIGSVEKNSCLFVATQLEVRVCAAGWIRLHLQVRCIRRDHGRIRRDGSTRFTRH